MDSKHSKCPICGNTYEFEKKIENGEEFWRCAYCGYRFIETFAKREYEKLEAKLKNELKSDLDSAIAEALLREKTEKYYNLRSLLWKKIHSNNINDSTIADTCQDILALAPHDFLAEFFELASNGNDAELVEYVHNINVEENALLIDLVIDYLIRSLKEEFIAPTAALIEKCEKTVFTPAKHRECLTKFETEAAKVKRGIYEVEVERHVFLAYSSRDLYHVNKILKVIEDNGLTCFAAFRNLQRGRGSTRDYEKKLTKAIDKCSIFVFISSKNSRRHDCDAYSKELEYIKKREMDKFPQYRSYEQIPDKYKKLRIEYRLDHNPTPLVDKSLKEFFSGLSYAEDYDQLISQLAECLEKLNSTYKNNDEDEKRKKEAEELKHEREKFAAQKEAWEREVADTKRRAEQEALAKEKAKLAAEKAAWEKQKAEEEKRLRVAEQEKRKAEAEALRAKKAEEKRNANAIKQAQKARAAIARREKKEAAHDSMVQVFENIGDALELPLTWSIIIPILIGLIIGGMAIGNVTFSFPNVFMIILYSVCAALIFITTLIVSNNCDTWCWILGLASFPVFTFFIFFGGIIPDKWSAIPAIISLILATYIFFAIIREDPISFFDDIADPSYLSTVIYIFVPVCVAAARISGMFSFSFPYAVDFGFIKIPALLWIIAYALTTCLCVTMTYVDIESRDEPQFAFLWCPAAFLCVGSIFFGGYMPAPVLLAVLGIAVFLFVIVCVSFGADLMTSEVLGHPMSWGIALLILALLTALGLKFSGILDFKFISYHFEFGTAPDGEPFEPIDLPEWSIILIYAGTVVWGITVSLIQAANESKFLPILCVLLSIPSVFLAFFNGYIAQFWIHAVIISASIASLTVIANVDI